MRELSSFRVRGRGRGRGRRRGRRRGRGRGLLCPDSSFLLSVEHSSSEISFTPRLPSFPQCICLIHSPPLEKKFLSRAHFIPCTHLPSTLIQCPFPTPALPSWLHPVYSCSETTAGPMSPLTTTFLPPSSHSHCHSLALASLNDSKSLPIVSENSTT